MPFTQLQTIATPGRRLGSFAGKAALAFSSYGVPKLYTSANWSGVTFAFEVYMRATAGTVHARMFNETDSLAVAGSDLSTASATFVRLRSGSLSLTDGKEYRSQFALGAGGTGFTLGATPIGVGT